MIDIRGLVKRFGDFTAVDGVSFRVERGEVLGFLGPNGAGKSTTMKMVTGFLTPTAGSALVCGHDVASEPIAVKERLGYLPEGAPAYPDMTPESFLNFIASIRGLSGRARRDRLAQVVSRVHLEGVMRQSIDTLSKGYKRRVGLAQAILHDPEVLIMDEPTDGLDPNQKHEVRSLIAEMAPRKAIVLSTHILEEVEAVCTRAIIIDRGRIVANGTPQELKQRSDMAGAVSLRVIGVTGDTVKSRLASVTGASKATIVREDGGSVWARAYPAEGSVNGTLARGIADVCVKEGWKFEELHTEEGRLDEVFRNITWSETARKEDK